MNKHLNSYLFLIVVFSILIITQCANTKTSTDTISKYNFIKLEQQIKKLELDLEYAKVLNQNINYIDGYWKNNIKRIKNYINNNDNFNKANFLNQVLNLDKYYDIKIKYPKNHTLVVDKYYDIIMDIVKLNKNFTNNIITNIPTDFDTENVKNIFVQRIFFSNDFFIILQQGLDKIYKLESEFITRKNNYNYDYEFFKDKYVLYSNSYQNILNKIYLFKLQNQIELNKILGTHKINTYEHLEDYIFNEIIKLTSKIIQYLEK